MWITFRFCGKVIDFFLDAVESLGYIAFYCELLYKMNRSTGTTHH